jgi:hypothetical protein
VFTYPDVADLVFPPLLTAVENDRGVQESMVIAPRLAESEEAYVVNQEDPICLSWSPQGFARSYDLQISTSPSFESISLEVSELREAYFVWEEAEPGTVYHYRVRTQNEGGVGDWAIGSFATAAPTVEVTSPSNGDQWDPGQDYLIRWQDNFPEDVVIELFHEDAFVQTIATVRSDGVFEWSVPLDMAAGRAYSVKISSTTSPERTAMSAGAFAIGRLRLTNVETSSEGEIVVQWAGTVDPVYVDFSPSLFPPDWQEIAGPIEELNWSDALPEGHEAGFYRIRIE